jgi:ABC-type multidrug transport system fused ATPase/permease subunit
MIEKLAKLVRYLGPLWRAFAFFIVISLTAAIFESVSFVSLVPLLEMLSTPDSLSSRTRWAKETFEVFGFNPYIGFASLFCLMIFLSQGMLLFNTMYSSRFIGAVTNEWRRAIFLRTLQGDIEAVGSGKSSVIIDIVYTQTKAAAAFLRTLCNMLTKGSLSAFLAALLLWTSPTLTVVVVAGFLGVFIAVRPLFQRKATEYGARSVRLGRRLMAVLHETLAGYREIQIFNLQTRQAARLNDANQALLANSLRQALISQLPTAAIPLGIAVITLMLVVYMVLTWTTTLAVNVPLVVLFLAVGQRLGGAAASAISGWLQLRMGLPAFIGVCNLVDGHRPPVSLGLPVPGLRSDIMLREVTFTYPGRDPLFERLNLVLARGCLTALVGVSGSGKSTIADLIIGMRRPLTGDVYINDQPLSLLNLNDWRARIGYVSQSSVLFDATVADNIRLGKPDATEAEVVNSAMLTRAHEFIVRLEEGYKTRLGERGGKLSGGERQRISIARALVRDPDLLIFDEPTNSLDSESCEYFQELLGDLEVRGKTILLITHDRSIIPASARVIDMAGLQLAAPAQLTPSA